MSDSPPPFGEEEPVAATPSTVDIDLDDDEKPDKEEAKAKPEPAGASSRQSATTAVVNDDLFFSTISDPEQHAEVPIYLNSANGVFRYLLQQKNRKI